MPWRDWIDIRAPRRAAAAHPEMPLTLVTLLGRPGVSREEYAFYAEAERAVLTHWAEAGWLVLAFPALERDEMTLICTEPLAAMRERIWTLPLVSAELVDAKLHTVMSMRLTTGAFVGDRVGYA